MVSDFSVGDKVKFRIGQARPPDYEYTVVEVRVRALSRSDISNGRQPGDVDMIRLSGIGCYFAYRLENTRGPW